MKIKEKELLKNTNLSQIRYSTVLITLVADQLRPRYFKGKLGPCSAAVQAG